jgi:hypothetical protein
MARPQKNNLDYFSHDCDMRNDIKIKALRNKFSHKGYSIYNMMLEHLSDCDYFQYEWNELNILLLSSDFDVPTNDLVEIIEFCVKLKLLSIEEGYLFCVTLHTRNSHILPRRTGFDFNNSPIMQLKLQKPNSNDTETKLMLQKHNDNLHSIEKNSIGKDSIVQDSIEQNTIVEDSIEQDTIAENIGMDIFHTKHLTSNKNLSKEELDYNLLVDALNNSKTLPKDLKDIALVIVEGNPTRTQVAKLADNKHYFERIGAMKPYLNKFGITI